MADDAKELFNHVAFLVITGNKHASLEHGLRSLLTLPPHLSVLAALPRPARRPAPDSSFPLTACCSSLSLPILSFQPLGVIRPLSCCPSVSLARETILGLAELDTSYLYVECSRLLFWSSDVCYVSVELRAKDMTAQLLQGFTESVTVTYSRGGEEWACPVGVRNAKEDYGGRKLSGGMVLFWGSPTLPLIFPRDFPWAIWTPLFLFESQSPASWPSGGRMMLSLCYCRGLGRKATVSLVFNLGTESGRETYLLVVTIHQKMTCFWLKAMRNIEQ